MKSYRTLAIKELLSQKVTSILILLAVILSTMMTTIVGQSIGALAAMREQQAIMIGGKRYATFLQMDAEQLHALRKDQRLSYIGASIYIGSMKLTRAIGMSATSLYKIFLWEGAYYGIFASIIGGFLGYVCTIFIGAATSGSIQWVSVPIISIIQATVLAVVACLVATSIPLRKITKMSIVDSIESVE